MFVSSKKLISNLNIVLYRESLEHVIIFYYIMSINTEKSGYKNYGCISRNICPL